MVKVFIRTVFKFLTILILNLPHQSISLKVKLWSESSHLWMLNF